MKESRLAFTKYLTGHPLDSSEVINLSLNGLPSWLRHQLPKRDLTNGEVRMWLTLLNMSRAITLPPKLDVESIITPSKHRMNEIHSKEVERALRTLLIRKWEWKWLEFHQSTKSGPNGQALASCLVDLNSLPKSLWDTLKSLGGKAFRVKATWLKHKDFQSFYNHSWPLVKGDKFRKLAFFSDKETKTRTIAIMDYWSQTILRPLHNRINSYLKKIKTDCTFNQDHFQSCLRDSGPYYSLDLKSATDRMPIDFQQIIVQWIVGQKKAIEWRNILVGWGFHSDAGLIEYKAGQPMGAYSSWPVMALTHHVIVRIAAARVGHNLYENYALLGDDIVIGDADVAESYKNILSILDIPISLQKTHVSDDMYEFAKRWIRRNEEVTGFSSSGLLETWKSYPLFLNFFETQVRNGWKLKQDKAPGDFLADIMKAGGKVEQSTRTKKLLNVFCLLKEYLRELSSDPIQKLYDLLDVPYEKPISEHECEAFNIMIKEVFQNQAVKDNALFQESITDYLILTLEKIHSYIKEKRIEAKVTNFLWLTFTKRHPISLLVDYRMKSIAEQLEEISSGNFNFQEVFTSKEIFSKFWTKDIFNMRQSNSKILGQSRLVKDVLTRIISMKEGKSVEIRPPNWSLIKEKRQKMSLLTKELRAITDPLRKKL